MASGLHTNCPSLNFFPIVLLTHKASYSKSLIRKNWPKHLFKTILMLKSERKQNLKIQVLLAGNSLNSCPSSGPISQTKSININSIIILNFFSKSDFVCPCIVHLNAMGKWVTNKFEKYYQTTTLALAFRNNFWQCECCVDLLYNHIACDNQADCFRCFRLQSK